MPSSTHSSAAIHDNTCALRIAYGTYRVVLSAENPLNIETALRYH